MGSTCTCHICYESLGGAKMRRMYILNKNKHKTEQNIEITHSFAEHSKDDSQGNCFG